MTNQIFCTIMFFILSTCLLAQPSISKSSPNSFNQGNGVLNNYLISHQSKISSDQVFVQTDRNLYSPGDTIHFQAYTRNAITGEIESGSASLYAMLFNEQREIADSSRFKVFGSTVSGWLAIPQKAKLGKYRLVAYTGMMQNDDPENAFQLDLKVDSKLVEPETATVKFNKEFYVPGDTIEATVKVTNYKKHPIADKKVIVSLKNGTRLNEVERNHTNNDGETVVKFVVPNSDINKYELQVEFNKNTNKVYISKNFDIPLRAKYIDFSLLPEGGTLVLGREQRIGFNAVNAGGQSIAIVGLLKDKDGLLIDTIQSGKYGPGLFTCRPQKGMYVELINDDYEKKIWPLPAFDVPDVCMSVKTSGNGSIVILIQSTKYKGEEYSIAGFMNTVQYFQQDFKLNKKESFAIGTREIPTGALQVMLFNKEMKPLAQRMVYVNADKRLKFNITSDTSAYSPGQETELTVNITDSMGNPEKGIFSISAVNFSSGIDPETFIPNIEYSFNYCPYLKKNLPPKVLVDGLENIGDNERDLLLMVYGWSKIHNDSIKKDLVNYEALKMELLYTIKSRRDNRRIDLIALEGLNTKHLFTDRKGQVSFLLDSLDKNTRTILIQPDEEYLKKVWGVSLTFPSNKAYRKNSLAVNLFPNIPKEDNKLKNEMFTFAVSDTTTAIPEVLIKGYVPRVFNDEFQEDFQTCNTRNAAFEDLWSANRMSIAINRLTLVYNNPEIDDEIIIISPNSGLASLSKRWASAVGTKSEAGIGTKSEAGINALIVLDGSPLPIGQGWSMIKFMRPRDLKSLTILKDESGIFRYGKDAIGGIIFVTSAPYDDSKYSQRYYNWRMRNNQDMMCKPINIYRYDVEFYNPTKAEIASYPEFQDRPTIYWNPNIYFDGKEPVKIKYPNNYMQGPVLVTINGVSGNNLVGSGKFSYWVKNKIN